MEPAMVIVGVGAAARAGLRAPGRVGATLAVLLALALASPARASDTVETWDAGATDVDFYLGFEGLNADGGGSFGDIMLGYGIVERFSAYLGTTLTSDEQLDDGAAEMYLGVFGTLVDTAHFDLDLFLHVAAGDGAFELAPAIEVNVDADPNMQTWGGYLRSHFPVHGREQPFEDMPSETTYHVAVTVGGYRTIRARHQVLLEYSVDYHPDAADDHERIELGALAAGYNVQLTDSLELVNEVYVDASAADGEPWSFGIMTGFIATLPSARK